MPTLKHVVIVNDHARINGGQAKVAIESAIALKSAGLRVTFFSGCGPADDRLADFGVEVVCLGITVDYGDTLPFTLLLQAQSQVLPLAPAKL